MRYIQVELQIGGYWIDDMNYVGRKIHNHVLNDQVSRVYDLKQVIFELGYSLDFACISYFKDKARSHKVVLNNDYDVITLVDYAKRVEPLRLYVNHEELETNGDDDDEDDESGDYVNDVGPTMALGNSDDDGGNGLCDDFYIGQPFDSRECFKEAIFKYSMVKKLSIEFTKSEAKKVRAVCTNVGCDWKIYGSQTTASNLWYVRTFNGVHTCSGDGRVKLLCARKIAEQFMDEFRTCPDLTAKQIRMRLTSQGIKVSRDKCQTARTICRKTMLAEHAEQFERLYDYKLELEDSNPGSTVKLGTKNHVFERFYVCFASQKTGWMQACRRVIHIDGTFLKGAIRGELLTAVGRDANNQLYPIAWAVVPVENKVNWEWFLELLQEDLHFELGNGLVLVSDKQKGLIWAIEQVCPYVEHRMCAIHIWANLKKKYGDNAQLKMAFWKVARAYSMKKYENYLEKLKTIKLEAYEDLLKCGSSHWARAFFSDFAKCDSVDNNMSESFNAAIADARANPIVQMLEDIRRIVATTNEHKRVLTTRHQGQLTPWAQTLVNKAKDTSMENHISDFGRGLFEVEHRSSKYKVKVHAEVSCTCMRYELSGIPCSHIVSALWANGNGKKPEDLVSHWFLLTTWAKTYEKNIQPANGMSLWPRSNIVKVLPPLEKAMPGRPKKKKHASLIHLTNLKRCLKTGPNRFAVNVYN